MNLIKLIPFFTSLIFSAQLEVEGNLKVNGTVNANGNPVTNVGVPTSLNDALLMEMYYKMLSEMMEIMSILFYTYDSYMLQMEETQRKDMFNM